MRALSGTDVPHAELIAADDTGTVLGMPFYVMRAIDGWSPMDGGVAGAVRHRPRRPGAGWRSNSSKAPPSWAGWIGAHKDSTASAGPTDSMNGRSIAG